MIDIASIIAKPCRCINIQNSAVRLAISRESSSVANRYKTVTRYVRTSAPLARVF